MEIFLTLCKCKWGKEALAVQNWYEQLAGKYWGFELWGENHCMLIR
ncbi:hypothetical protein [Bacteroides mediterraneensis]|nr:hypothetical protein [Bacteroides mediterraneensis]